MSRSIRRAIIGDPFWDTKGWVVQTKPRKGKVTKYMKVTHGILNEYLSVRLECGHVQHLSSMNDVKDGFAHCRFCTCPELDV